MTSEQYDLKDCFNRAGEGDEKAFALIFDQFKKRVYAVALKMTKSEIEAEETVQEVFVSLWRMGEKLREIEKPEGYIFTVTYNTIYSRLKKISRNKELLNGLLIRMVIKQNTTLDTIDAKETSRIIYEAIQTLPPQQRTVFELSKNQELSYLEIADYMGLSKNTVRNHLSEAMKSVRHFIDNHLPLYWIFLSIIINLKK